MTGEEALTQLSEIQPAEFRKLQELADRICADSRQSMQALLRLCQGGAAEDASKAEAVLSSLRELAVVPWLEASESGGSDRQSVALTRATQAYSGAVVKVKSTLDEMMKGKSPMPAPTGGGMSEEKELPSRECDEGYLLARTLLKADESDMDRMFVRNQFLLLEPARRDVEIASQVKTGKWATIVPPDTGELRIEDD